MMRKWIILFGLVFGWGLSFSNYQKQDQTIRVAVRQVYLQVRVFDKSAPLKLGQENFRVWEEVKNIQGKTERVEQVIEGFARYENMRMALAMAIDSSDSMRLSSVSASEYNKPRNKLEMAKNAGRDFFEAVFREGHDQGLISEFFFEARHVHENGKHLVILTNLFIDQNWTSYSREIYHGLQRIQKPGGATPIRDALFNLAGHFQEVDRDCLRVAVILSDGEDTSDGAFEGQMKINSHSLEEVVMELQNNQVMVFAVGLYKKTSLTIGFRPKPHDILEVLAQSTGGEAFYEINLSRLSTIFAKIGEMVRSVNFLSYTPSNHTEGPRRIVVEVGKRDHKGEWRKRKVTTFHRKGYYYKEAR